MNLIRKAGLNATESARRVSHYLAWTVIDNDSLLLTASFEIQARWQLSYWDSLIVAAAQRAGATQSWTEDLAQGQIMATCVRSTRCGCREGHANAGDNVRHGGPGARVLGAVHIYSAPHSPSISGATLRQSHEASRVNLTLTLTPLPDVMVVTSRPHTDPYGSSPACHAPCRFCRNRLTARR